MKRKDGKQFCRYALYDFETGRALIIGSKWKDVSKLNYTGWFWIPFRVIWHYDRYVVIRGRTYKIVYWANAPRERQGCSLVLAGGSSLGLRGDKYLEDDVVYPMRDGELL